MPPAEEYCFPAFETCSISAEDSYLPALNELSLLVDDKELFSRYVQLEKDLVFMGIKEDDGCCRIWSSTDAQRHYSDDDFDRSYSDAYAVNIDNDGTPKTHSLRKTEEAWCIPFCRF